MRLWLTEKEQAKLNKLFGGTLPRFQHVHITYTSIRGVASYSTDIILENSYDLDSNFRYSTPSDYKLNAAESYKSMSLSQLIELIPSTIYCDDEYNAVDPEKVKIHKTLKFHIIKRNDENNDINYKYQVCYKPVNAQTVKKKIIIKKYDYKDPVLESDELIEIIFDMVMWCISHGHLSKKEDKLTTTVSIVRRGH